MKKIQYIAAGLLLCFAFASTACSKKRSGAVVEDEKEIHIRVWESKDGIDDFIKQAGKAYTQQHPNVIIDFIYLELHNAVAALEEVAPKGVGPDIIAAPHDNLGALVTKNLIVPTVNPAQVSKQVLGACSKALTYNKTMYGYPASAETYALFYNRRLISDSEVPTTWEGLVDWVKNFNKTHPGQLGFVMDFTGGYYAIIFTTANGNRLYGESGAESGSPNMNTPAAIKGVKFMQSLRSELGLQNIDLNTNTCDGLFASGNAAMYITGLWNVKPFENAGIDFGVVSLPSLPGESNPAASFSGTRGMFVTTCSRHPEEAADFATFMLSPEMQQLRFKLTGAMPSINTTVSSKYMPGFIKQLDYAFPMPSIPAMGKFWNETGAAFSNIWNGADVETELNQLNNKIRG